MRVDRYGKDATTISLGSFCQQVQRHARSWKNFPAYKPRLGQRFQRFFVTADIGGQRTEWPQFRIECDGAVGAQIEAPHIKFNQ